MISLEAFNVSGWLTHGDLALETQADFLAVSEHRLIPARFVVLGLNFGGRVFTLSGPQLPRRAHRLVMLVLGL